MNVAPRAIVAACRRHGIATELLQACPQHFLSTPDRRVPFEVVSGLWEEANRLTRLGSIGLSASQLVPFGAYKSYDHLMASAPTLGDALKKAAEFHCVLNEALSLEVSTSHAGNAEVALSWSGVHQPTRGYVDYILANLVGRLRLTTDTHWAPREVHFTFAKPESSDTYDALFQAPVKFGQRSNRIVVSHEAMSLAQPAANAALCESLGRHVLGQAVRLADAREFFARFSRILGEAAKAPSGLDTLAQETAVSRRTLQRRLRERGMTYRALRDDLRCESALALLRDANVTCEAVAVALGFSEVSAFNRAFKRWTGKSPGEFRSASRLAHSVKVRPPEIA